MAGIFLESELVYEAPESEALVYGDSQTLTTMTQEGQDPVGTSWDWAKVKDVINTGVSVIKDVGAAAKDIGTAVGTVQREVKQAPIEYERARANAASGNVLAQWWHLSSTTDKLVVGLAIVGIIVAIRSK